MRIFLIIVYLLLIIFGVSFATLNAASVKLNFYVTTLVLPLSVLLILTLAIGVFFGCVVFLCKYWRVKSENRRMKHQLKMTEKEIKNLRAIPLQDQH